MTTEERKSANRMIAEKIEGAKVREDSNEFSTLFVIDAGIPRTDYFSLYSSTPEGAWDELTIDYFADEQACWRAKDALLMGMILAENGRGFHVYLGNPTFTGTAFHPEITSEIEGHGTSRAEAVATALYEYAKTL